VLSFILLLLSQQADNTTTFTPIPPGNQVPMGSYLVTVPDGVYMAGEQDAATIYRLAGTEFVPNCTGVFFSGEDTGFIVIIQHYPFQSFTLEPPVDGSVFDQLFTQTHLLLNEPYEGGTDVFIPATRSEADQTFTYGIHYFDTESKPGYFAKKAWVSDQDALLMTLTASEESYPANQEIIESIFQSVVPNETYEKVPLSLEPQSYLSLLGIRRDEPAQDASAGGEEVPGVDPMIYVASGALIVGAIVLMVMATRMKKRAAKPSDEA